MFHVLENNIHIITPIFTHQQIDVATQQMTLTNNTHVKLTLTGQHRK